MDGRAIRVCQPNRDRSMARRALPAVAILLYLGMVAGIRPAQAQGSQGPAAVQYSHMSETLRAGIRKVVIVPKGNATDKELAGSYGKDTPGLSGGMVQGASMGTPSIELGGINVSTSIPQLILPGMIAGSLVGKARKEVQDFRDALADDLAESSDQALTNARLALHVYQELRHLGRLEPTLISTSSPRPKDTNASLLVSVRDIAIDVRDDEAILKTTAEIDLVDDQGNSLYKTWFYYQDQDSLSNWTRNDNTLWHDYANFAVHYLGREIAEEVFAAVDVREALKPLGSDSISTGRNDAWRGSSKFLNPVFAWSFSQEDGSTENPPWAGAAGTPAVTFDFEIYDSTRPVYARQGIDGTSHTPSISLEPCKTYWWSVRPVYRLGDIVRHGEWLRQAASGDDAAIQGNKGSKASELPAYLRGFPALSMNCRAK